MEASSLRCTVASLVELVHAQAIDRHGVPEDIASDAAAATLKALGRESADHRLTRRVRSYFWAVVRRSLVRRRSAPELRARFVLSTVAADLAQAGRSPAAVWDEIQRGWSDKVPIEVLDEYRARLCA